MLCCCYCAGAVKRSDNKGTFTAYEIEVTSGSRKWQVYRRFKQFYVLNAALARILPNLEFPKLPSKRLFGSSLVPGTTRFTSAVSASHSLNRACAGFVEKRRAKLDEYISQVVHKPQVWRSNDLVLFLDSASHFLQAQVLLHRLLDHTRYVNFHAIC